MDMSWASYTLGDLLMFSPSTYERMHALTHQAWWPVSVLLGVALGVTVLKACLHASGAPQRAVPWIAASLVLVGIALLSSAVLFVHARFADIFSGGDVAAILLGVGAVALVVAGVFTRLRPVLTRVGPMRRRVGAGLVFYALLVHPLAWLALGRPVEASEWFGLAPDPGAVAALGVLALAGQRGGVWLAAVPAAWLLFSATMHAAMAGI
ncbi:MAG: hypothetical protein ACPGUC_00190 [Gammaproteobacteria bacterium]